VTTIQSRLALIRERIALAAARSGREPGAVTLVAVSKRVPVDRLQEAVSAGQSVFGENYLQEAVEKIADLPGQVWHFIGAIQSNKVRQIAENFDVVETVDRLKIAHALEKQLADLGKVMAVFIQVNIGREPQKAGVLTEYLDELVVGIGDCPHLRLAGLMAMPPNALDPESSRGYFRQMKGLAEDLAAKELTSQELGLSMGMSMDFEIAIEEGATLVRVGSALFGDRA
jgi:pyridoxal phosphate enzyme (YggS family)